MQLEFIIHEQTIEAVPTNSIPRRGSKEYLTLRFLFAADWSRYTKTVYFQHGVFSEPILIDETGVVDVPSYFTSKDSFLVMVLGVNDGVAVPTNILSVSLADSGTAWENVPPDTDMPAYQQLVSIAQDAAASAAAARIAAEAAENAKSAYDIAVENGYSGTESEWLESLRGPQGIPGETQFDSAAAEKLRSVANNFLGLSSSSIVGVPVSYPEYGIANAEILLASGEEHQQIKLVSSGKAKEMIRKDITADYAAWSPEDGTAKTVENYAKTLPDGSYRVANDTIGYLIDTLTVYGYMQWRIIREYDDEFCYISLYCGDYLGLYIDTEVGYVQSGGRTLLTNENIPYPTAADVGKVLTASAAGKAGWTAVTNAEEVAY